MQLKADCLKWQPEYCLGDRQTDVERRQLLEVVAEFVRAVNSGFGRQMTDRILGFFLENAGRCFANEEIVMQMASYPFAQEHASAHSGFIAIISELTQQSGNRDVSKDLAMLLMGWTQVHTLGFDVDAARFVHERAVQIGTA